MSQKASPTAIGAFVLGAVALVITGLLVFGAGTFLKETETYMLYFQGNAKGLNVGAPTSFRGVSIGTVTDVNLVIDNATLEHFIAVKVEIDRDVIHKVNNQEGEDTHSDEIPMSELIEKHGLRAKLSMLSLVTGQLYIGLAYYPDTPVNLTGFDKQIEEIPTLPSTMEKFGGTLQSLLNDLKDLPLRELVNQLLATVENINHLVESRNMKNIPEVLHAGLVNLRDLSAKLNKHVVPVTSSIEKASDEATETLQDIRIALRDDQENIVRLADSIEQAAKEAKILLGEADELVSTIDADKLDTLINELSEAARSIRVFADYLERHPDALIRGKN